jgi:hypothetical protein
VAPLVFIVHLMDSRHDYQAYEASLSETRKSVLTIDFHICNVQALSIILRPSFLSKLLQECFIH